MHPNVPVTSQRQSDCTDSQGLAGQHVRGREVRSTCHALHQRCCLRKLRLGRRGAHIRKQYQQVQQITTTYHDAVLRAEQRKTEAHMDTGTAYQSQQQLPCGDHGHASLQTVSMVSTLQHADSQVKGLGRRSQTTQKWDSNGHTQEQLEAAGGKRPLPRGAMQTEGQVGSGDSSTHGRTHLKGKRPFTTFHVRFCRLSNNTKLRRVQVAQKGVTLGRHSLHVTD